MTSAQNATGLLFIGVTGAPTGFYTEAQFLKCL